MDKVEFEGEVRERTLAQEFIDHLLETPLSPRTAFEYSHYMRGSTTFGGRCPEATHREDVRYHHLIVTVQAPYRQLSVMEIIRRDLSKPVEGEEGEVVSRYLHVHERYVRGKDGRRVCRKCGSTEDRHHFYFNEEWNAEHLGCLNCGSDFSWCDW